MTNQEIVDIYLNNGLIRTCVDYQFMKQDKTYKEDYFQDLIVELLLFDNEKLNDAHARNHMNALLTRIIQNNLFSNTSWFYRRYRKWDSLTDEISDKELNIPDGKNEG